MSSAFQIYLDRPTLVGPHHAAPGPREDADLRRGRSAAGLGWRTAAMLVAHAAETGVLLASWACIGLGALSGRIDPGWLVGWTLALGSLVPLHAMSTWLQGLVSVGAGEWLKARLFELALSVDADSRDGLGPGELLSKVMDGEAIDDLAASGGVVTLLAVVELALTPLVFLTGAAGPWQVAVLLVWMCLTVILIRRNLTCRTEWTRQRLGLTRDMVEQLGAHRTRLVQQPPEARHVDEDAALERYVRISRKLDASAAAIEAALPRGYVLLACAAMAPAFIAGTATLAELAVTFGAILYTAGALERFCFGYSRAAAAWVAWRNLAALPSEVDPPPAAELSESTGPALHIHGLGFSFPGRHADVLHGLTTVIDAEDKVLLQGTSGGGKSVLASILSGSRAATRGFVLLGGLDRQSLGARAWRRHVVRVPQFHDNYLFAAPLLVNLLLSKPQPYSTQDVEDALSVCRELGLAELITRMPRGVHQVVGTGGWRLSQGECSRVFLARALLQRADIVILDGCLATLDPHCLRLCLDTVLRRARTAIVIANP